jgi:hypothetical protein
MAVAFVAIDIRSTPESPVLKWGFVLLTAYTGPIGAFLYVLGCREPLPLRPQSIGGPDRCAHDRPTSGAQNERSGEFDCRGTIGGSRADRDYRRSRHDNPPNSPRTPMAPWLVTQPAPLGPINIPNTNSRTTAGARMNSDDRASNGASTAMKPMIKRA